MSGCRIGRVRLKGAATVLPFRQTERDYLQGQIVKNAAGIANSYASGEMDGYLVIGWSKDGAYNIGYRLPFDGVITPTLLPSWLSDVVRRESITNGTWS